MTPFGIISPAARQAGCARSVGMSILLMSDGLGQGFAEGSQKVVLSSFPL